MTFYVMFSIISTTILQQCVNKKGKKRGILIIQINILQEEALKSLILCGNKNVKNRTISLLLYQNTIHLNKKKKKH